MTIENVREIKRIGAGFLMKNYYIIGIMSSLVAVFYAIVISDAIGFDNFLRGMGIGTIFGILMLLFLRRFEKNISIESLLLAYVILYIISDFFVVLAYYGIYASFWTAFQFGFFGTIATVKSNSFLELMSMGYLGFEGRAKFVSGKTMMFSIGQITGAIMSFFITFPLAVVIIEILRIMFLRYVKMIKLKENKIATEDTHVSFRGNVKGVLITFGTLLLMYVSLVIMVNVRSIYVKSVFGMHWVSAFMLANYIILAFGVPYGIKFVTSGNILKRSVLLMAIPAVVYYSTSSLVVQTIDILVGIYVLNITIWGVRHFFFKSAPVSKTGEIIYMGYFASMFSRSILFVISFFTNNSPVVAISYAFVILVGVLLLTGGLVFGSKNKNFNIFAVENS